ncbi:uncharacterized protein LOC113790504 [Dermatophagoides pteronyssinus]|uniref:Uncharacterized protein LOC113790504 n=1 Tax=Dermatophagoides pteronyssinus TaxID=6956 RepID=A0A6P6XRF8_DERPT|nr:uncharacterized protein LOC113790504 [Dermatophagoides pteronyssinus]
MNLNLNIFNHKPRTKKPKRFTSIASRNRCCHFCSNQNGRYECSQCHRPYCSIDCFRSQTHQDCSEQFYKRMVLEQLKNDHYSNDKEKFMEILRRNQNSADYVDMLKTSDDDDNDDDEVEEIDLDWINDDRMHQFMERIMSICLDDNVDLESIWTDQLTESDRKEFIEIIETNPDYFNRIIPKCQPWWLQKEWQTIVEDIDNEIDLAEKTYPKLIDDQKIEPISKLLSQKTASPLLIHSIVSVCFAYCYLYRSYNGELIIDNDGDQWLIIDKLYHIVPELQPNRSIQTEKPFDTIELLINRMLTIDCDEQQNNNDLLNNINQRKEIIIEIMDDLQIILDWNQPGRRLLIKTTTDEINHQSPKAILLILSDLYRIIDNVRSKVKRSDQKSNHHHHKQLKLLQQKIRFYISFAIEMGREIQRQHWLDALEFHREKLRQEIEQIHNQIINDNDDDDDHQQQKGLKPLIEEIG